MLPGNLCDLSELSVRAGPEEIACTNREGVLREIGQ